MTEKKKITTRARAPEKKKEQFNKILEEGKELFIKYGSHGFSLRALAKRLKMSQSNLYNYVQSKRELWIAIRIKYFKEFQEKFTEIVETHKDSYVDIWLKMATFFLDFAQADYRRFTIMFLISAPPSEKIGPFEKKYKPFQLVEQALLVVEQAIDAKKIKKDSAIELFYFVYGVLLGAAQVEFQLSKKIYHPITTEQQRLSVEKFRKFTLEEISKRVEQELL